jgi:hypothetical protein
MSGSIRVKVISFVGLTVSLAVFCGLLLAACSDLGTTTSGSQGAATVNDLTGTSAPPATTQAGPPTPVYVTIYFHNEDSWGPYVRTETDYRDYRANLLAKLQLAAQYKAKIDWQSDITVLQGMLDYEKGDLLTDTSGKTIVKYMAEDLGFSVDPHGHLNKCNYADLAYLVEQLGAPTPQVIGGCRLFEFGGSYLGFLNLLDWRKQIELGADGVIHGRLYPAARWTPTILSVPAMSGHWCDEWSSGVWRPGKGTDFFTDDPSGKIVYVGQGYPHSQANLGSKQASGATVFQQQVEYIQELTAKLASGELPADRIYTASLHVRDLPVVKDSGANVDTLEGLRTVLGALKPLHEAGKIVYATYPEVVEIWQSQYGAVASRVPFEGFSMCDQVIAQALGKAGVKPSAGGPGPTPTSLPKRPPTTH